MKKLSKLRLFEICINYVENNNLMSIFSV